MGKDEATRQVIDVSGDGVNNSGPPADQQRDAAIAEGITINGLPIITMELKNTATGMLVIEWKSADDKEMSRTLSKMWDPGLSKLRWEQISINNAEPPKGAVSATFGIHFCDGKSGASGSVFVDDVMLIEK